MPRSRTNPQFNRESLPETLAPWQIGYEHIAALGGLRGKARTVGTSPNAYWRVRGFRNYADYALTKAFGSGLSRLRELGGQHRCAIMCAEAVWWRCHRRIITDYLLGRRACDAHPRTISCRRGQPDARSRGVRRHDPLSSREPAIGINAMLLPT
jgi:uncharacterized protein (DUF488 family)